jgi:hypothetical protein
VKSASYSVATHFCIVWGVALAVITLLEWRSLDRDPVRQEILSPFIERRMAVTVDSAPAPARDSGEFFEAEESPDAELRYEVDFAFNGPLFLAFFFAPMLVFQAAALLWQRLRRG